MYYLCDIKSLELDGQDEYKGAYRRFGVIYL
jgi:hypothetical protein